ncbi:MAG: XrtN system VIT domain-containing protein [Spirosomataceae bacterium]
MKLNPSPNPPSANELTEEEIFTIQPSNRLWQWWVSTDSSYRVGLGLLLLSLFWFTESHLLVPGFKNESGGFVPIYLIAIGYTIHLLIVRKMRPFWSKQPHEGLSHRLLNWWIWIVSCFALNRSFPVFQESADWVCVALVISGALGIMHSGLPLAAARFREVFYFCWGSSLCLWLYFTGYLLWLYPVSFFGLLFFGLGFHTFVPLLLLIAHVKVIKEGSKQLGGTVPLLGIITPLLVVGMLLIQWVRTTHRMNDQYAEMETTASDELPIWVKLAQKTDKSWLTERILKSDLVYQVPSERLDWMPLGNLEEIRCHDPIVMLGTLLAKPNLAQRDRIKLLETLYDARHQTQDRLWTGRNLRTAEIITHARIYPSFRLAYTEKTLSIQNTASSQWRQEEAIYTFFVPEGSVVTSLSLWINGKEEKGYLTTQAKADSAYKTIVGRESRDPAIAHWQEGNTIRVRVFPCTPRENRRFKIGITSPLRVEQDRLVYDNIYFKGPNNTQTSETVRIEWTEKVEKLTGPWPADGEKLMTHQGDYTPDWSVQFEAKPLSTDLFRYQGKSYRAEPCSTEYEAFTPTAVYIDVNEAWRWTEFEAICAQLNYRNVWVYDDQMIRVTAQNEQALFTKLAQNRFSLFPVYRISQPDKALLITKGIAETPSLTEIKESIFAENLQQTAAKLSTIRTFCLNNTLSPYQKTLRELRLLAVSHGSPDELQILLQKHRFRRFRESKDRTVAFIEPAQMNIRALADQPGDTDSQEVKAPDHLLRLYAYNHILQQIGGLYFQKEYLADSLVSEAARAHVVTPISSLVVLETQADYERFGIKRSLNSLENAALKKSGAVPEPHEWALAALLIGLIVYAWLRPNAHLF